MRPATESRHPGRIQRCKPEDVHRGPRSTAHPQLPPALSLTQGRRPCRRTLDGFPRARPCHSHARSEPPGSRQPAMGRYPMATVTGHESALSDVEHKRHLRRAVIASTIGTTIEWYDFFLYSTVTGLIFAKLYFPADDPLTGTLNAFGIYAVGFIARPVGAAIFEHYGDRIGRKSTLIATLLLMGIATFLVAFVPT